jgi:excisionase family DNA binding protein
MLGIFEMVEEKTEWITVLKAAEIMDVTPQTVQRLCRDGILISERFGRAWMVSRESAENYEKTEGGRGKSLAPKTD